MACMAKELKLQPMIWVKVVMVSLEETQAQLTATRDRVRNSQQVVMQKVDLMKQWAQGSA